MPPKLYGKSGFPPQVQMRSFIHTIQNQYKMREDELLRSTFFSYLTYKYYVYYTVYRKRMNLHPKYSRNLYLNFANQRIKFQLISRLHHSRQITQYFNRASRLRLGW